MNYLKIFEEVEKHFGKELAVMVNVFMVLNLSKKIEIEHLQNVGSFTSEIVDKAHGLMWNTSWDMVLKAQQIWECIYDWEISQTLGVSKLGGCKPETLKQIYDKKYA